MKIKRFIIFALASGFGSGYLPLLPGTAGSFCALIIFLLLPLGDQIWLVIIAITFLAGIRIGDIVEKEYGKDPGFVVIDEFAGQWLTFLFLPLDFSLLVAGFILFRIFDIIKPFPANHAQKINGGLGIMLDDIIAAVYAQVVLRIIIFFIT